MSCRPIRTLGQAGLLVLVVATFGVVGACSVPETGDKSLGIDISMMAVTVDNQTGQSLTKGEINIMPQGTGKPFVALLPHMSNGEKRSFPLDQFRSEGTPFRRNVAKAKSVKVTATDVSGKTYEHEVPFK